MRRTLILILLSGFLTQSIQAQFLVESNGNVAVKPTNDPVLSDFAVNRPGDSNTCTYIYTHKDSHHCGLEIEKGGLATTGYNFNMGLKSSVIASLGSTKKNYGIYAHSYKVTGLMDTSTGYMYGIYALAGNGLYNYGVFGTLFGYNDGAGVYGSSISSDAGISTGGRYAGFFHGDVKATNAMYATAFNTPSDYRFKENIESVGSESIDGLMKLNVVKYDLKQITVDTGDTAKVPEYYYTDDSKVLERKHYGIIAQELQQIYPDLVYEGKDGYLSVNYMEIIPILVKTIQDLKVKVDNISDNPEKAAQRNEKAINATDILPSVVLYQNNPNPFTENTEIKCFVPDGITKADLYIYDMNGHQIDKRPIYNRGYVSIIIQGSSLDAGMYLYSLITDGAVVDTKRMILTK